MDYLEFFNLKEEPFRLNPDPFYFYPSESHNEALSSLNYMVEQKEGFFLVTGECGTGKTTLLNTFLNTSKWKDNAGIALVLTPRLSPEEFLLTVLEDLNVKIKDTNKNEIIKAFRDFLVENSILGRRIIIIVDEAQNLPDDTLEELRLLSNLETEKEKLLQIILVGQPELKERLLSKGLEQLNQRISVRAALRAFNREEVSDYINFRLIKAGKALVTFEEPAKKLVHKISRGIPRLINLLSSRALMAAYLDGNKTIKKRHVMYAVRHLSDSPGPSWGLRPVFRYAVYAILLSCAIFTAVLYLNQKSTEHRPEVNIVNPEQINEQKAVPVPLAEEERNSKNVSNKKTGAVTAESADLRSKPSPEHKSEVNAVKPEQINEQRTVPVPNKKTGKVMVESANLRSKPSHESKIVSLVHKGDVLEIIEQFVEPDGKKWHKVIGPDGKESWVADTVLQLPE